MSAQARLESACVRLAPSAYGLEIEEQCLGAGVWAIAGDRWVKIADSISGPWAPWDLLRHLTVVGAVGDLQRVRSRTAQRRHANRAAHSGAGDICNLAQFVSWLSPKAQTK